MYYKIKFNQESIFKDIPVKENQFGVVESDDELNAVAYLQHMIGQNFLVEILDIEEVKDAEQCLYDTIVCDQSCKGCKLGNQNA